MPSARRRFAAALAVLATGLSTVTASAADAVTERSAPGSTPTLHWAKCKGNQGPAGAQCATLPVPLDYANPRLGTIRIALDRMPATGHKIGSLLLNPGGPGASGVDGLTYEASLLSSSVRSHFDLIGFDPRGVARSDPVECLNGKAMDHYIGLDPAPTTQAGFNALVKGDRVFAAACKRNSGRILPYVGTINAARDMDRIRAALGEAKLNYFGFSYGTYLGAVYAGLFPTHIRTMVLDGAIDPALNPIVSNEQQSAAFDKNLDAFFAYCEADAHCAWKPGTSDLAAAFNSLMAQIRQHRLPGSGGRTLGPGEAFYGVALTLYDTSTWPDLAEALQDAERGDGATLLNYSDQYLDRSSSGHYDNMIAAETAIGCMDAKWPTNPAVYQQDAGAAAQQAPVFGVADLYSEINCAVWPVHSHVVAKPITAAGSPPIVVIGSTGDPATPYQQAVSLAHELSRGVLITRVGDGHTGYRSSACVRQKVDAYLLARTVPVNGTSCPSN